MTKIPFEEQRVIDELADFWRIRCEPRNLITHLDRLSGSWGSGVGASFFKQVYEDVRTDKRSKYAVSSASEFKLLLESEYIKQAQIHEKLKAQARAKIEADRKAEAERKAQESAEAKEKAKRLAQEKESRARVAFEAMGKQMKKTTNRTELVELGKKRAKLAAFTGYSYIYQNHCWNCYGPISSDIHAQCPNCKFYICSSCNSCLCGYLNNQE